MTPEAKAKAATTKRMTALAGIRLPLPGQCLNHESDLRARIAADLKPEGFAEMTWASNIASCETAIEVIRAQIAAVERRQIQSAYEQLCADEDERLLELVPNPLLKELPEVVPAPRESRFLDEEWDILHEYAAMGFEADWKDSMLNEPLFCILLARAGTYFGEQLQRLRSALREDPLRPAGKVRSSLLQTGAQLCAARRQRTKLILLLRSAFEPHPMSEWR